MSDIQLRKWEIVMGKQTIPVTSDMVVDAMSKAESSVSKTYATSDIIRSDPNLLIEWEMAVLIIELVKHQFSVLFSMEMNSQVTMKIPHKQRPS